MKYNHSLTYNNSRWLQGEFNRTGSLVAQTKRTAISTMSRNASTVGAPNNSPQHGRSGVVSRDTTISQPHTPDIIHTNGMSPSLSGNDLKSLHPLSQVALRRKTSYTHLAPTQRHCDDELLISPQLTRILGGQAWNSRHNT